MYKSPWRSVFDDPPDWQDVGKCVKLRRENSVISGQLEADVWGEDIPIMSVGSKSIFDFAEWRLS